MLNIKAMKQMAQQRDLFIIACSQGGGIHAQLLIALCYSVMSAIALAINLNSFIILLVAVWLASS